MGHMTSGRWRNAVSALVLGSTLLTLAPGCVVRMRARGSLVADSEPPPPQQEVVPAPRAGYVWVRGYWAWTNGDWQWQGGHWERARQNYVWVDGHWERRGNRYHWVEGRWQASGSGSVQSDGPTVHDHRVRPARNPRNEGAVVGVQVKPAPPQPQAEVVPAPRAGYVWVRGHWEWRGNQYVWEKGHWERERQQMRWVDGHWERQSNNDWIWIEGRWEAR
jgi:hypothetical protein